MEEGVLRQLIKDSAPIFVLDNIHEDELFNKVVESFQAVSLFFC